MRSTLPLVLSAIGVGLVPSLSLQHREDTRNRAAYFLDNNPDR